MPNEVLTNKNVTKTFRAEIFMIHVLRAKFFIASTFILHFGMFNNFIKLLKMFMRKI